MCNNKINGNKMSKGLWIVLLCIVQNSIAVLSPPKTPLNPWPALFSSKPICPTVPPWEDLKPGIQDLTSKLIIPPNFQSLEKGLNNNCEDNIVELIAEEYKIENGTENGEAKMADSEEQIKEDAVILNQQTNLGATPNFIPIFRPKIMQNSKTDHQKESKDLVVQFISQGNSKPVLKSVALTSDKEYVESLPNMVSLNGGQLNNLLLNVSPTNPSVSPSSLPSNSNSLNMNPYIISSDYPTNVDLNINLSNTPPSTAVYTSNLPSNMNPFNTPNSVHHPNPPYSLPNTSPSSQKVNSLSTLSNTNTSPSNSIPLNLVPASSISSCTPYVLNSNSVPSCPPFQAALPDCKEFTNKCIDGSTKGDLVIFKPETVSLLNTYGDFLKKLTMTVLVPMYVSKFDF